MKNAHCPGELVASSREQIAESVRPVVALHGPSPVRRSVSSGSCFGDAVPHHGYLCLRDCSRRRLGHGRLHNEILLGGEGNAQPGGYSNGAETAETQQRDPYCSEVRCEQAGDDGWADDQHQ